MKKLIVCVLTLSLFFAGCQQKAPQQTTNSHNQDATQIKTEGNFSSDMKITPAIDLSKDDGADSVERNGDHENSPYYKSPDFYNMESSSSLTILPHFKTMQQSSEWSCGVTSTLMVLNYFNALGDYNEQTLAEIRSNGLKPEATSLKDVVKIFETVGGFNVESTYNYGEDKAAEYMTLEKIQETLKSGSPIMVAWNDWGGHWQTIIGYDTMGTEATQDDVIIMADSYDTTDHNQDGYTVYGAERFYYNWTMYDFFTKNYDINERSHLFCTVTPKSK